jgi:hypothetical protein
MVENLDRLGVCGRRIPSAGYQLTETRHLDPEVFESEGGGAARATEVAKQKRAMI